MVGRIQVVRQRREHRVVGDRALHELDHGVVGEVVAFGREQVVDDDDPLAAPLGERAYEVRADEPGAADDQDVLRPLRHCVGTFRCVNVSVTPLER